MTLTVERIDLTASRPTGNTVGAQRIAQRNLVRNPRFAYSTSGWSGAERVTDPGVALPAGATACGIGNALATTIYADDYDHTKRFIPGDTYSVRGSFYAGGGGTLVLKVVWGDAVAESVVYNGAVSSVEFTDASGVVTVPTVAGYESGFDYATLMASLS